MANIKLDGHTWDTSGVYDAEQAKTQKEINADVSDLKSALDEQSDRINALEGMKFGTAEEIIISGYSASNQTNSTFATAPFVFFRSWMDSSYNYDGKLITGIEIYIRTAGTFSVGYTTSHASRGSSYSSDMLVTIETITATQTGLQIFMFDNPFIVPSTGDLFLGKSTDTAGIYYGNNGSEKGFFYVNTGSSTFADSPASVNVNWIGGTLVDCSNVLPQLSEKPLNVQALLSEYSTNVLFDSFNSGATSSSTMQSAPFVLMKNPKSLSYLYSLRLNIKTIGTLTIGTIKKSNFSVGGTFDADYHSPLATLTIDKTGDVTIYFDELLTVQNDEYIYIGASTDTCVFYYGGSGVDNGFAWTNHNSNIYQSNNSAFGVNIEILAKVVNTDESIYKNKTLSILGDSISTYSGYIPEGNVTYYPSGDVQSVNDTWWKKLADALGMTINVNNSWSGSRVTTTNGDTSAGCMTRSQSLGINPDVIIIWMGVNDFNNEVDIGTYDGTTAIPSTTTTFREAYGVMLNKVLTAYKTSEVWVCTLPQCEQNSSEEFPEINGNEIALAEFNKAILELANAFGVKVLDHNKCGLTYQNMSVYDPNKLHPNKAGHSLIANNDIWTMDNFVRLRY